MTASQPALVLCELADARAHGAESHSPFCLKVHRALRAAGLAYTRRHGARPASFAAYNPSLQVPVLLVDGAPVADSTAILRWIVATRPGAFAQPDARATSEAWLWEELADTAINGFLVAARWADDANWPGVREAYFGGAPWPVRAVVAPALRRGVVRALVGRDVWRSGPEACWRRFDALLDDLEVRAPREGFWLGPALSVADVALFGQLWSVRLDLTPRQRDALRSRPALDAWLRRVDAATQG